MFVGRRMTRNVVTVTKDMKVTTKYEEWSSGRSGYGAEGNYKGLLAHFL